MVKEEKKLILFVCSANSFRSQIAQAWANYLHGKDVLAFSAGVRPSKLSIAAVETMAKVSVDISDSYAKEIDEFCGLDFDLTVTLSEDAKSYFAHANVNSKFVHYEISDPTAAILNVKDKEKAIDNCRDEIKVIIDAVVGN